MKPWLALLLALALVPAAAAQEFPRPAEEGKKALRELLDRCVAAGGLSVVKDPKGGNDRLVLADAAKLRTTVAARRALLTPALRDALVSRWEDVDDSQQPAVAALLRVLGQETKDDRALAFAAFFAGNLEQRQRQYATALRAYHEAKRLFAGSQDRGWEATCLSNIGSVYHDQDEYARALEHYRQALTLRRQIHGEDSSYVARSLSLIGQVHADQGEYAQALEYQQQALALRRKVHGEDSPEVARSLHAIGMVYLDMREHARAVEHLQQALRIRRRLHGENHPDVARSLNILGLVYFSQAEYGQALEHYRQALAIGRQLHGEDHADVAACLNIMGRVYAEQGDYAQALEHYHRALAIRRKVLGVYHPQVATSLDCIGMAYANQGEYAQSLPLFQEALAIHRQVYGDQSLNVASSLVQIGFVEAHQGEYTRALEHYRQALTIRRKVLGEQHADVAACLRRMGLVYAALGESVRSLEHHQQALAIYRKVLGEHHPDVASAWNALGEANAEQGEHAAALEHFQHALFIWRRSPGTHQSEVATCLGNIALVYHEQAEYAQALENFGQALAVHRKVNGEHSPHVAAGLVNIGRVYADQGEQDLALDHYQQGLAIYRKLHGEGHPNVATCLLNIGLVFDNQGDHAGSLEALTAAALALRQTPGKARAPFEQLGPADFQALPLTAQVLYQRGVTLERTLKRTPAVTQMRACVQTYDLAAALLDRVRQEVLHSETSKLFQGAEVANLFPRRIGLYQRLFEREGKTEDLEAAFSAAEQGTARVFLEALGKSRAQAIGRVSRELRQQEAVLLQKLRDLDSRVTQEQSQPLGKRNPEAVGKLFDEQRHCEADLKQLVAVMEEKYPQYAALKYPKPCTLARARACLAPKEVALLYVLGSEASYVLLVEAQPARGDPANGLAIITLPDREAIADLVAGLTDSDTLAVPARVRTLGAEGYRMLLAPVKDRIQGKDLVIVPSGVLGLLPFEVLVDESGKYLVEQHGIRYAPSLTALAMVQQWEKVRAEPDQPLWAVGDPIYNPKDERLTGEVVVPSASQNALRELQWREGRPGDEFPRLRFSATEVRAVAELLQAPDDSFFLGRKASEAKVKEASAAGVLARARHVHFATHGILGFGKGQQPALVLSLVGNDGKQDEFEGVNDGFLCLDEVTRLRLNADLVVLSACRSGQGQLHDGEGVRGLARAFLYAGSRGVVCSLWAVNDKETAFLMKAMYRHRQKGGGAAAALRDAQLDMIEAGKPPLYWAPFILIGE